MRNPLIDFARGYAMLTIVLFHLLQPFVRSGWLAQGIEYGGAGVHVFFLLSGLGLALGRALSAAEFYRRRFLRVLVPYYVIVVLLFLGRDVLPLYGETGIRALGGHLFGYRMFDRSLFFSFRFEYWFLVPLIQLYLVYPVLRRVAARWGTGRFAMISGGLSAAWWVLMGILGPEVSPVLRYFFLQYLWEFVLGMWLAGRLPAVTQWVMKVPATGLAAGAVFGTAFTGLLVLKGGEIGRLLNDLPAFVGYTATLLVAYRVIRRLAPPLVGVFGWVGQVSLLLYLTHGVVISSCLVMLRAAGWASPSVLWSLPTLLLVFAVTIGFGKLVEFGTRFVEAKPGSQPLQPGRP